MKWEEGRPSCRLEKEKYLDAGDAKLRLQYPRQIQRKTLRIGQLEGRGGDPDRGWTLDAETLPRADTPARLEQRADNKPKI